MRGNSLEIDVGIVWDYHHHPDPVVPVYWLVDEIAPSVEQAISACDSG
jgi:hypothetical protein